MNINKEGNQKAGLSQKEQLIEVMAIGLGILLLLGSFAKVLFF